MAERRTHSPSARSIRKILAVDDEEIMGYVIQRVVRHLGYQVEWVTDCETALARIETERFDAILSDFRLPSMSGERFYEEIGLRDKKLLKKLVFITGDTISTKTVKYLRKTEVPYLSKPFKIEELERILQNIAL